MQSEMLCTYTSTQTIISCSNLEKAVSDSHAMHQGDKDAPESAVCIETTASNPSLLENSKPTSEPSSRDSTHDSPDIYPRLPQLTIHILTVILLNLNPTKMVSDDLATPPVEQEPNDSIVHSESASSNVSLQVPESVKPTHESSGARLISAPINQMESNSIPDPEEVVSDGFPTPPGVPDPLDSVACHETTLPNPSLPEVIKPTNGPSSGASVHELPRKPFTSTMQNRIQCLAEGR